ncbi:MAG: hypothetical protein IT306_25345 [Chloroflexi bacterium]|nr:hypothetical protein [Chloroflexota bacterium]
MATSALEAPHRPARTASQTVAAASALTDDRLLRLLPFLVALFVYGAAYLHMQPTPTGDEPHYILYSHSLVFDHDADLANNYDRATVQRYFPYYGQLDPHGREYLGDGTIHSIHYLGVPLLISPIILAGGGLAAVRALMLLLSALLAYQVFGLLKDTRLGSGGYVWLAWIATALCMPMLTFSGQVYPEFPGALLIVSCLRVLLRTRPTHRALVLAMLGAAVLPWLHFRFIVFAAGIGLGVLYHLARGLTPVGTLRAGLQRLREPAAWRVFWPALLPVSTLLALSIVTYRLYGSPWPPAMYAPELASIAPWSLAIAYRHGLGALFSPGDGWLPYAPVQWLGLAALIPLAVRFRRATPAVLLFVGVYFLLVAGPVAVGNSLPARYIVVLTPLVAVPLLLAIATSVAARLLFVPLLGLSLVLASLGVLHHTLLYQDGSALPSLPLATELQEIWPDIGADRPRLPLTTRLEFVVAPATAQRQTGRVVDGTAAPVAFAAPGTDQPGMLSYGPYRPLLPGRYVARFHLAAAGDAPIRSVATLDIMTELPVLYTVLAQRDIRLGDLPTGGGYTTVELPFTVRERGRIETRVRYHGETELWLGSIEVLPAAIQDTVDQQFPSWPRTLLWLVLTVFVGGLLVGPARRAPASLER